MKALKVSLIVVAVLIAVVVVLAGAGIYFANRYVQSPAFKEQVLAAAHKELGLDVRIDEFKASLFSGVSLRGVTISNPKEFSGNLLTADTFVLRYRLLPLLHRRVEIEQLSLDKPVITLARNDKSEWNYEKVGANQGETKPPVTTPQSTTAPAEKSPEAIPLNIVLSRLALTHGAVSLISEENKPLVKIDGIEFSSSVSFTDGKLAGTGKTSFDKVSVAEALFVQTLAAPVAMSADTIKLAPISGKIADGAVTGDAALQLTPAFKYMVNLQIKDSDVAKLLTEAGTKQAMNGKMQATVSLKGSGGLPTIIGNGRVEIDDGQLMEIPLLETLATVLQIDILHDLKFSECVVEFSISNNVMQTPVIRLKSPQIQITGKGSVSLDDHSLKHDMTLTFAKGVLDRYPSEIRDVLTEQPDGSRALDFKVRGTYESPKPDLVKRILRGIGQQLLQKLSE